MFPGRILFLTVIFYTGNSIGNENFFNNPEQTYFGLSSTTLEYTTILGRSFHKMSELKTNLVSQEFGEPQQMNLTSSKNLCKPQDDPFPQGGGPEKKLSFHCFFDEHDNSLAATRFLAVLDANLTALDRLDLIVMTLKLKQRARNETILARNQPNRFSCLVEYVLQTEILIINYRYAADQDLQITT